MKFLTYFICLLSALTAMACGGGGGSSSSSTTPTAPMSAVQNVQLITIDRGPDIGSNQSVGVVNIPYVTVTVCQPGSTTQCQSIDKILVDTGSSGLRIISSVLSGNIVLPSVINNSGTPLAECMRFADGYSWGSVKKADMRVAGEVASGISVQMIGDAAFPSVPSVCAGSLVARETAAGLHANGILGIASFLQDCGGACASQALEGWYYACPNSNCTAISLALSQQVGNPVAAFPQDNNGTVIQLPAVGANGGVGVTGSLIFGIGTQADNALGSASIYTLNSFGNLNVLYQGQTIRGFFDIGSNGLFFADSSISVCTVNTGFYCPSATLGRSAVNTGQNGVSNNVSFNVANADSLFQSNPDNTAFSNLAGGEAIASFFDWGLPFFFGRSVYTAVEGATAGGVVGPYVAY